MNGTKEKLTNLQAEQVTKATRSGKQNKMSEEQTNVVAEVAAPAEFDWNAVGKKAEIYSEKERKEWETMYEETLKSIANHEVLDGVIVGKTSKDLLVNIGYKSEGAIPLNEVRYNPDIKIGDLLEVYVENQEDKGGQLVLSHKKARSLRSWERINKALEKDRKSR